MQASWLLHLLLKLNALLKTQLVKRHGQISVCLLLNPQTKTAPLLFDCAVCRADCRVLLLLLLLLLFANTLARLIWPPCSLSPCKIRDL